MGIALISSQVQWYTPEGYEEDPEPPKFKLKPLEADVYSEVTMDMKQTDEGDWRPSSRAINKAIKAGLVGWQNVGDDAKCVTSNIKKLPPALYLDVAAQIIEISSLGEDEAKNS